VHDLVEQRCKAFVIDAPVVRLTVFYSVSWTDYRTAAPCNQPVFDYIEYGDERVGLCVEHFILAQKMLPKTLYDEWKTENGFEEATQRLCADIQQTLSEWDE
jgi:hypothetical protein